MSDNEKAIIQRISNAALALPDGERKYIIGYAEGVIAASEAARRAADPSS